MAVKNRPTIGTVHCEHCGGTRSVHQYEGGRHGGKLYTRCPSCEVAANKFISKTSKAEQAFLRSKMTLKPEYAELLTPNENPKTQDEQRGTEENHDPKPTPKTDTTPTPKGKGSALVFGVFSVLLITIGVIAR